MSVRELRVRDRADGREELAAVDVQATLSQSSPQESRAPVLGTADLVQLAGALSTLGYRIMRIDVRGAHFEILDEEEGQLLEQRFLQRLRDGQIGDLERELAQGLRSRVVSVEVRTPEPERARVKISRDGSLTGPNDLDAGAFLRALQAAWNQVFKA